MRHIHCRKTRLIRLAPGEEAVQPPKIRVLLAIFGRWANRYTVSLSPEIGDHVLRLRRRHIDELAGL